MLDACPTQRSEGGLDFGCWMLSFECVLGTTGGLCDGRLVGC